MVDLVIKNGRMIVPQGVIYGGIGIEGSKIICIGNNSCLPEGNRVIDAEGHFIIPGLIDPHVHLAGGVWPSLEEGLEAQFSKETEGPCMVVLLPWDISFQRPKELLFCLPWIQLLK